MISRVNKKVIRYCSETLKKMIIYHKPGDEAIMDISNDLKRLMLINTCNLYKVGTYNREEDRDFFVALTERLFEKYISTEIVKQWLILFISNSGIKFEEIICAADHFNSKILEIEVKVNDKIELSRRREEQIIEFVLTKAIKETVVENDYDYFVVRLMKNGGDPQRVAPQQDMNDNHHQRIFDREYVESLGKQDKSQKISESELFNVIFDYFIINKQKENL